MSNAVQLYDDLRVLDETVAKALRVNELARIARIETLSRQFLHVTWERLARKAAKAAKLAVERGRAKLTETNIKSVGDAIDKVMAEWAGMVTKRFIDDAERIYRLGRTAGHKKGTGKTRASLRFDTTEFSAVSKQDAPEIGFSFDLVDEGAVEALRRNQTFWIGVHYNQNVSDLVRRVARETIVEAGFSRVVAGAVMEETMRETLRQVQAPSGWVGQSKQYFEGLAANAATVGRVQGQLKSFVDLGFEQYQWMAAGGIRMCPRCAHLDGKLFEVSRGFEMMEAELASDTPDDIRKIHPFISLGQLKAVSSRPGNVGLADTRRLADAGIAMPPVHLR